MKNLSMSSLGAFLIIIALCYCVFFLPVSPFRLTHDEAEIPGPKSNPKLASMANEKIQTELKRISVGTSYPGIKAESVAQSVLWLQEIESVVARCRFGRGGSQRFNRLEYDVVLKNKEEIKSVYSDTKCAYAPSPQENEKLPLVMKLVFDKGVAVNAFTDGRELKYPPKDAEYHIAQLTQRLLKIDWDRTPKSYYKSTAKTQEEIKKQWDN